jgi:hypothetical protein
MLSVVMLNVIMVNVVAPLSALSIMLLQRAKMNFVVVEQI